MDFVVDHAVAIAAVIWGAAILVGIIAAVVAGLRMWRRSRLAHGRIAPAAAELAEATDRAQQRLDAVPERGEELRAAIHELQLQIEAVSAIAETAAEAADTFRSPLRYLGR